MDDDDDDEQERRSKHSSVNFLTITVENVVFFLFFLVFVVVVVVKVTHNKISKEIDITCANKDESRIYFLYDKSQINHGFVQVISGEGEHLLCRFVFFFSVFFQLKHLTRKKYKRKISNKINFNFANVLNYSVHLTNMFKQTFCFGFFFSVF